MKNVKIGGSKISLSKILFQTDEKTIRDISIENAINFFLDLEAKLFKTFVIEILIPMKF